VNQSKAGDLMWFISSSSHVMTPTNEEGTMVFFSHSKKNAGARHVYRIFNEFGIHLEKSINP
jgi:hypothetical protein